jgi:predicted  nucleic acid-binding Zn-ribbon protein
MIPEISHRCPSCGASVRDFGERAMFCPECGENLTETRSAKADQETSQAAVEGEAGSDAPKPPLVPPGVTWEAAVPVKAVDAKVDTDKTPVVEDRHTARERTRETLHRASNMARGAIEDNVKRVEKIHHVSTVMLEEATYDPSLRFVLVAAGLFVVFVILLILSKVMG